VKCVVHKRGSTFHHSFVMETTSCQRPDCLLFLSPLVHSRLGAPFALLEHVEHDKLFHGGGGGGGAAVRLPRRRTLNISSVVALLTLQPPPGRRVDTALFGEYVKEEDVESAEPSLTVVQHLGPTLCCAHAA